MALKYAYGKVLRDKAVVDQDPDAIFVLNFLSAWGTNNATLRMKEMLAKIGYSKWIETKNKKTQLGTEGYYLALYFAVKECSASASTAASLLPPTRTKPNLRLIHCSKM